MKIVKQNIKTLAKARGWKMQDVATELYPALTKENSRARLYSALNRTKIDPEVLRKISVLLGVSVDELCLEVN